MESNRVRGPFVPRATRISSAFCEQYERLPVGSRPSFQMALIHVILSVNANTTRCKFGQHSCANIFVRFREFKDEHEGGGWSTSPGLKKKSQLKSVSGSKEANKTVIPPQIIF